MYTYAHYDMHEFNIIFYVETAHSRQLPAIPVARAMLVQIELKLALLHGDLQTYNLQSLTLLAVWS